MGSTEQKQERKAIRILESYRIKVCDGICIYLREMLSFFLAGQGTIDWTHGIDSTCRHRKEKMVIVEANENINYLVLYLTLLC
jgi:hypothetical protein